jgi:uncharacterized protein (DUF1778 family)
MTAPVSEIRDSVEMCGPEPGRCAWLNLHPSATDAALVRQAAEARRMSVSQFVLEAAVAEAQRAMTHDRSAAVINEVFDRLEAALGEAEDSVDDLINDAKNQSSP